MTKEDEVLLELLGAARRENEELRESQERARPACVRAVRKLEAALVEALDGEKLRGLPMLYFSPDKRLRLFGARARGPEMDSRLPLDGRSVMVFGEDGRLRMALRDLVANCYRVRPVEDSELLYEDVEDAGRVVAALLRVHVDSVRGRSEKYRRFEAMAERLEAAVAA